MNLRTGRINRRVTAGAGATALLVVVGMVAPPGQAHAAGGTSQTLACVDVSPSFPVEVRTAFTDALSASVRGYADAPAGDLRKGSPARHGVRVAVRPIGADSYASMNTATAVLAAVPGVAPMKDGEKATVTVDRIRARRDRATAVDANKAVAAKFADQLAAWQPPSRRGSDVVGCVLAAAALLGHGGGRMFLVSDLESTTEPAQTSARLDTVDVTVVQSCTKATRCEQLAAKWSGVLSGLGARSVEFVRPEQIADAVRIA